MFLDYLLADDQAAALLRRLRPGQALYAPSFLAAYAAAGIIASRPGSWLVLAADGEAAARLAGDLGVFLGCEVAVLPARGVPWGGDLAPAPHVCGERQEALLALARGELVVAEAAAALERFPPPEMQSAPLELTAGAELGFERALAQLAALGYERVEQVHERGQFAVRGGLLDVYPTSGEPVRAEFWGDVVDSLRRFSIFSQRTIAPVEHFVAYACGEVDTQAADYCRNLERVLDELAEEDRIADHGGEGLYADSTITDAEDLPAIEVQRRASLRAVEALSQRFITLGQAAGEASLLVVDPDEVARALADAGAGLAPVGAEERHRFYGSPAGVQDWLRSAVAVETIRRDQTRRLDAARPQVAARDINAAERDLSRLVADGYRTFVVFRHAGEAGRAAYRLKTLEAEVLDAAPARDAGAAAPGARGPAAPQDPGLYFVAAPLRDGFVSASLKLAVVPERALLRAARQEPRFVGGARLSSFFDLRLGDYVVHEDYGIARFSGIETKTVAGVTRDYLFLQFKGDDKVFLPHDQIGKVSRYIGAGAGAPALNSLSGTAWQAVRTRARHAVLEMAGELLTLYAARQAQPGFAFGPDGELLARLEDAFPFDETDDQAAAIDDVKNDLEAAWPMDRLVCGDVGYGKTEVAIRAALKVAESGKQTLVLVPTTILAQQHMATFSERFKDFPVVVDMVSRFRTPAETRRILRDFREGRVDVLIGTHRLLSRDVAPHDLGLVIVDEEQRFGVRQKELLRQLKLQVDVMSLSATPIPRTLQMSLSGIRDISVIETPPRGRHEIRTYIGEYRDDLARAASEQQVERTGQAFYLHNRVETIEEAAEQVRQLAPQARVMVAHGQMHEHQLEKVMGAFLAGEADVLVTTSIIESGIDIPTVNTLIVDRADALGLAQLYQIRGRIGRSDEHAYAYLLYPSDAHLSGEAMARLRTLSDHTELGAGFRIAMADLEIRGAGNLLGDEQSGHVAAIGFELYVQMLEEAVGELRGQPVTQERVVRVEIPVSAYIPGDYIEWEATKIDVHHRIARARSLKDLENLRAELEDRFGEPPQPVIDLLGLQAVRLTAAALGANAVSYAGGRLTVDGLRLDEEWAARARAGNERLVYFDRKAVLVAHVPAGTAPAHTRIAETARPAPGFNVVEWARQTLDGIAAARATTPVA